MGQTITEDAESVDELDKGPEDAKELDSIDGRLDDKLEYGPEFGEDRYAKANSYKKSEKKSDKKSSGSGEESLEKKVKETKAREVHDSFDGAHVIVYHLDPKTGKVYFTFEKKPADYPVSEYAGTLSLYGGSIKIGESPKDGLVREIKEEDPSVYKIIIEALNETRWKVAEISRHIDGVPSTTYIWAAEIKDPNKWSAYLLGRSTEGDKTPKSLEEIMGIKNSDFAFGFGPIIKGVANVLSERHSKQAGFNLSYSPPSSSAFHYMN